MIFRFILLSIVAIGFQKQVVALPTSPSQTQQLWLKSFSESYDLNERWLALQKASLLDPRSLMTKTNLQKALKHEQWFMRSGALAALAQVDSDEALKAAKVLVQDKALVVRSAAVDFLSQKASYPTIREVLWTELYRKYNYNKGANLWIRHKILNILAQSPLKSEKNMFAKLAEEEKDANLVLQARTTLAAMNKSL